MADLPRLNGVIRALEQGRQAFTCFSPAEIDSAYAISTSKYDGVVSERAPNPRSGRPSAARQPAIHAQPRADRQSGFDRANGHPDGAHSGERRREGTVAGQAGA